MNVTAKSRGVEPRTSLRVRIMVFDVVFFSSLIFIILLFSDYLVFFPHSSSSSSHSPFCYLRFIIAMSLNPLVTTAVTPATYLATQKSGGLIFRYSALSLSLSLSLSLPPSLSLALVFHRHAFFAVQNTATSERGCRYHARQREQGLLFPSRSALLFV